MSRQDSSSLLTVDGLSVTYSGDRGDVVAVDDVSFDVRPGEALGLVGESGCGKSSIAFALMRLLPRAGRAVGSVTIDGTEILGLAPGQMRGMRGQSLGIVFQAAMNALNPVMRIHDQVGEPLWRVGDSSKSEAQRRAIEMLEQVGLPANRCTSYPHELSGGQKQRVVIAMSLIRRPRLLIADEPTTALDVVVQDQILGTVAKLREELQFGLILISHDTGMVAENCDRVAVMYAGRIVEEGSTEAVLRQSKHPYTIDLLAARPSLYGNDHVRPMQGGVGVVNDSGCRYAPRCSLAVPACSVEPPLRALTDGRQVRCVLAGDEQPTRPAGVLAAPPSPSLAAAGAESGTSLEPLLRLGGVKRYYRPKGSLLSRVSKTDTVVRAVDGVDLTVGRGEIVALVGESGCGKSTLARMMVGLEQPTAGSVHLGDRLLRDLPRSDLTSRVQMVLQDPYRSLDPRHTIRRAIEEPLRAHGVRKGEFASRVESALEDVGLTPPELYADRYPHELSGGQRQRAAIARAIIVNPELIVADEPVSMLDVSTQAGVMDVMLRMRREHGVSFVFITHDLAVARYMSDRIAVVYLGRIVEIAESSEVMSAPRHPYTRMLLASVPEISGGRKRIDSSQMTVRPLSNGGCRFQPRCPLARSICSSDDPELREVNQMHWAACHVL